MEFSLAELAAEVGGVVQGDGNIPVSGLGTLQSARKGELAFLANPKYRRWLDSTNASAVLCTEEIAKGLKVSAIVVADPHLAFARISRHFDPAPASQAGVHARACVDPHASVDESASIGANAVIENGARIGAGAVVMANCYVGANAVVGPGVKLWPNVTIYHGVTIGEGTTIHAGSIVGSDGFGFAFDGRDWVKVTQVGGARIGRNVEIGANCTVDRGAIEDTIIGDNVIIDDQVHVAHNVVIGDHTAIAGKAGIAGSSRIGSYCMLGGMVGVAGHIEIADKVHVLGKSMVSRSITEPGVYGSALPVDKQPLWQKNVARFRNLDKLYRRLVKLEKHMSRED